MEVNTRMFKAAQVRYTKHRKSSLCAWQTGTMCITTSTVFSFCKMAGEQSIVLLASEFEGRGARIAENILTCFYCYIILSLEC